MSGSSEEETNKNYTKIIKSIAKESTIDKWLNALCHPLNCNPRNEWQNGEMSGNLFKPLYNNIYYLRL
jgi:hypothetical protein